MVVFLLISIFGINSFALGRWDLPTETVIVNPQSLEDDTKPNNWVSCLKCEIGVLYTRRLTLRDYNYVTPGHGSGCTIKNTNHYYLWYFDVDETYCNRCSYAYLNQVSGDYGWKCVLNQPN